MNYETIREKTENASVAIYRHLNGKGLIKSLKKEYLANIQAEYEDDREDYKNFKEYLEYNGEDYVNFAFGAYMENLIPIVSDVTEEDIGSLTDEEKGNLLEPFIKYFIEKSKMLKCRWFPANIVTIIREETE